MNTTTAAIEAGVTVATIRTWCARGIIAATKRAGRWIIDATSLTRRIQIGSRRMKPFTPAGHRVDTHLTIRVTHGTHPVTGRAYYHATPLINGYEVAGGRDGATPRDAYAACLKFRLAQRTREEAIEAADQAPSALSFVSSRGECHTCGLDTRTCDCR